VKYRYVDKIPYNQKNLRCFEKEGVTVNFNDKDWVTAFIGRNGSGKTTILEALNF